MSLNMGTAIAYLTMDISGFEKGFSSASKEMQDFSAKGQTTSGKIQAVGNTMTSVGNTMTKNVTLPILGAGAAIIKTGSDFEYAISQVKKTVITKDSYNESDFNKLVKQARQLGRDTKFTAVEVATALEKMGMAGWDTEQMMAGLPSILNMAIAGNEDLTLTSDIVTDALTAFGMSADKAGRLCDILAAASMNSNTNVGMMGESFKYAAPVAASLGYNAEDTALALGLMANAGIKSSMAGTSLRSVMTNLAHPVGQSEKAVAALGLELTHTDGSAKSFREVMNELRAKLGGIQVPAKEVRDRLAALDEQFAAGMITQEEYDLQVQALTESIYGKENADKAALAAMLAGKTGMSGLLSILTASQEDYDRLAKSIDTSTNSTTGYSAASEMAKVAQDNLQTDMDKMISSLADLSISIHELVKGPFGDFINGLADLIDWINDLDDGVKENIVRFGLFLAVIGPVVSFIGNLIKVVSSVGKGFGKFNGIIKLVTGAIGLGEGGAGIGLLGILGKLVGFLKGAVMGVISAVVGAIGAVPAAIIAVVLAIAGGLVLLYNHNEKFKEWVDNIAKAILDFIKDIPENLKAFWEWLGKFFGDVLDAVFEWAGNLWESAKEAGAKFVDGVMTVLQNLPDFIYEILNKIIDKVMEWVNKFIDSGKKTFQFVMTVHEIIAQLPGKLIEIFAKILKNLVDWFADFLKSGVDGAKNFLHGVVDVITGLPKMIIDILANVIMGIIDWGRNILREGVFAAEKFLFGIIDIIRNLPGGIGEHLADVLQNIVVWGADVILNGIDIGSNFLKNVVGFFADLGKGIFDHLGTALHVIIEWGANLIKGGIDIAKDFVGGFLDGIGKIGGLIAKVGKNIVRGLKKVGEGLFDVGKGYINWIVDGIKSGIGLVRDAVKWVIDGAANLLGVGQKTGTTNNPRSAGVRYVPYNNYGASLHEGEMVLTKQEAEAYRKGIRGNSGGGDIFVFNSPEAIDEREAARLLKQTKRELRLGF